jgi:hypothetical protein
MYKSKLTKVIVSLLRRILGVTRSGAKRLMRAMLQALMAIGRRAKLPVAGFVLPTVTMVLLVVILLTVAIVLRSFDRANTARNVRVNQQVLAAATPALDRAKAKIQFILREDPQRPTATPTDAELYTRMANANVAAGNPDTYTFGDEERLILKYPVNGGPTTTKAGDPKLPPLETIDGVTTESEAINTAWRYPVDTNNDGKFDTFTLYGIFFRNPPRRPADGEFYRAREPLDARTPPMSLGVLKKGCEAAAGNSASLVGDSGWYSINGKLLKSFFVYTVNVPIKQEDIAANALGSEYQPFTGTTSISALEYQQDQSRIPLSNNAVVYEDDLEISPGPALNINGRMITNSNFIVSVLNPNDNLKLYQVSSQDSCFYDQENSKIIVGGNVVNGGSGDKFPSNPVPAHLFKKKPVPPIKDQKISVAVSPGKTGQSVKSSTSTALDVLYNNQAFQSRINLLVEWQKTKPETDDPLSVQQNTKQSRDQKLESYFKLTTRKVPFAEVPFGENGTAGFDKPPTGPSPIEPGSSGENLRPIEAWNLPTDVNTKLSLEPDYLEATKIDPKNPIEEESYLGDRVVAGNSLPNLWWDSSKGKLVSSEQEFTGKWNAGETTPTRTRTSQIAQLADIGATDRGNGLGEKDDLRDGFWEAAAAQIPKTAVDGIGGLRVITSAGVYDRRNSFLPPPVWLDATGTRKEGRATINDALTPANTYDDPATPSPAVEEYPVVWPDTMPMSPLGPGSEVYNNAAAAGSTPSSNWVKFTWSADGTDLPPAVTANPTSPVVEVPANNPQYAKGDLRMRASAVYHYAEKGYNADEVVAPKQPIQEPIACISSYYDPSSSSTARNIDGLADVSGQGALSPAVLAGLPPLPGVGVPQPKVIGSNNGITYPAPATARPAGASNPVNGLLTGGDPVLDNQANLVFPDGRFANGPLRSALLVPDDKRTLAQKAAIDSTLCAIDILGGAAPNDAKIPHGAIQEVAFLNAREVKAVDRDDPATKVNETFTLSSPLSPDPEAAKLTGDYNQPIEERQPLEIRSTQIDLDQLRKKEIAQVNATGPSPEYLLPNSGIIYASRDDALPDRSNRTGNEKTDKRVSPSDSLLDPTRKPNGIVLINGKELFRGASPDLESETVTELVREKGLILVSNLPVYIKGEFNLHTGGSSGEEFNTALTNWESDFYGARGGLNSNFACRKGDPRLKDCSGGDTWRQATVLADAITLLSKNYRFGFRNEGDFDLRNNAGAAAVELRKQQGFFNNNFVTNGLTSGAFSNTGVLLPSGTSGLKDADYKNNTIPDKLDSSYFTNFATPVQRRAKFPEYLMEVCTKVPVSECQAADWYVDPLAATPVRANVIGGTYAPAANFKAGTTATPPVPELQRFPRRVAFKRDPGSYALDVSGGIPQPLGITGTTVNPGVGQLTDNSLWFATMPTTSSMSYDGTTGVPFVLNTNVNDGNDRPWLQAPVPPTYQPLLMPVLQIQTVELDNGTGTNPPFGKVVTETGWITRAYKEGTKFNLIIGGGDIPSRKLDSTRGESNGGLQNLPRFLESWQDGTPNNIKAKIQGSFIQLNRSAYATGPFQPILPPGSPPRTDPARTLKSLFKRPAISTVNDYEPPKATPTSPGYRIGGGGLIPFFIAPGRDWGFDVGQLSQSPDLFTQRFTTPPRKTQPAEYFREIPRDDKWVKTLMCAVTEKDTGIKATEILTPTDRAKCPT